MPLNSSEFRSIGQLSARTGLSVSAIRFYETKGLISPGRNSGGQRRFRRSDIRRLSFVLLTQQCGFSIGEIRTMLRSLPDERTPTRADWTRLSGKMRRELDRRIETLERLRDSLDSCIGCGCLSLQRCSLYNPGDAAAAKGAGPRYLLGDSPDSTN